MALKFDIKNVICINIGSLNQQQLFSISENYFLGFEPLVAIKNDGIERIWVEVNGDWLIAFSTSDEPQNMVVSKNFCPISKRDRDSLLKLKPIKTPKIPHNDEMLRNYEFYLSKGYKIKTKSLDIKLEKLNQQVLEQKSKPKNIEMDVDTILDKIVDSGMTSLTKRELKFLDDYSQKIK
jgi:hypothetical protein